MPPTKPQTQTLAKALGAAQPSRRRSSQLLERLAFVAQRKIMLGEAGDRDHEIFRRVLERMEQTEQAARRSLASVRIRG